MNRARVAGAWILLVVGVVGWPASALTLAKHEPQFVLGLSWAAIIIEAMNFLTASQVREKQDDE